MRDIMQFNLRSSLTLQVKHGEHMTLSLKNMAAVALIQAAKTGSEDIHVDVEEEPAQDDAV